MAIDTDLSKRKRASLPAYRGRFFFVVFIWLILAGIIVARMIDLNVFERHFLQSQGNARTLRTISIPAYRGMIVDRNGKPLAVSTPVAAAWVNPQEFAPSNTQLKRLASLLRLKQTEITKLTDKKNNNREFIYLRRQLSPELAAKIKKLKIPGLFFQREYRRFYPEANVTAHVLGLTNIDDQGQEGLELAYNDWLQGVPGRQRIVKDRLGHVVNVVGVLQKPKPGKDLVLSIDRRIQYIAYRSLAHAVKEFKASSGSVVVLDNRTGEILAMANVPSYNPNQRPKLHDGRFRNRAVTDVFEPGSTLKAFSVANALMSGRYQPDSIIDTTHGRLQLPGGLVRDDRDNNDLTVTQILQRSSNVGVTKLTLSLPPDSLWQLLHNMGFGEVTGSGFPGESAGILINHAKWKPFTLATLSFGYGMSVTALQLARAYGILANDGRDLRVSFLKGAGSTDTQQIVTSAVASAIRHMLETVIEQGGTATRARIPGYRVTGKTGTVRMVGPNGYEKNHHIGMFVGMAPASKPRLVTVVVIKDPQAGPYYGGLVAAPVFAKVMGSALRLLDVAPDKRVPA